ncbi:MAG: shikimate dehydrogenase family protein, partial [Chitinophagales bacterium]
MTHSFSAGYFTEKFRTLELFDYEYKLYPLEQLDHVRLLFQSYQDLIGLNVTIPYKESIIPYLDNLDISAQKIGAVNCIKIQDGIKTGYNTDYIGFIQSLQNKT